MTPKQFAAYLKRDTSCYHCGKAADDLIPQHRIGRGMGGSSKRNQSSNVIVLCSQANGLIEADADFAKTAIRYGWKLLSWQNPLKEPVYETATGLWWFLDDSGNRELAARPLAV